MTLAWALQTAVGESAFPAPRAAVVLSPWTDLALESESWRTRAEAEFFLTRDVLADATQRYLAGRDARDPLASPVYGELAGLPPVQVHVGDAEGLLDDSKRYVARAQAAGTAAELYVWEGMPHVFASNVGKLEASGQMLETASLFLAGHLQPSSP